MNDLKEMHSEKRKEIERKLRKFSSVNKNDYFYELCFCILTPQSAAKRCWEAVLEMKKNNFQNKNINPKRFLKKVRFYNNKTKYLLEMKKNYNKIKLMLNNDTEDLREWLVRNVKGLGLKEASHFLRNIGHKDLAILDRHILKNLKKYKIVSNLPKTLTDKNYYEIEKRFSKFSKKINIPIDHLDLLFWSSETGEMFK